GVPGTFDKITWTQNRKAASLKELIESIEFRVDVSSVNSKDKGRDATLSTKFFAMMKDKNVIKGEVKSFALDKKSSTAALTMNGVTKEVPFSVTAQDTTLTWTSNIDLTDQFQMAKAVASLAEACKALHIGKDGKSVTWDEVGLTVT